MATFYYDLAAAANGTGTSLSPFNLTGWNATTFSGGNSYLLRRTNVLTATFSTVAGTVGNFVNYGTWYNSDGSDDNNQAKPIVILPAPVTTYATTKDYVAIDSWDFRAYALTASSDSNVIFLGSANSITNCDIHTNVGGVGCYGKSGCNIQGNTIRAVAHNSSQTNYGVIVSDVATMTSNSVTDNLVIHLGGGGPASHGMRIECSGAPNVLTAPVVSRNTIRPTNNGQKPGLNLGIVSENRIYQKLVPFGGIVDGNLRTNTTFAPPCVNDNHGAIGIRLNNAPGAQVEGNTITGMLTGIFCVGGGVAQAANLSANYCCYNREFGIHLTTDMVSCSVVENTCSFNGQRVVDTILSGYGRGIEITSAAGQSRCASHSVFRNVCSNNFNWGGPNDNGSEGCGIGIDDGAVNCRVVGNVCTDNEGNGVQLYGGGSSATYVDTHNYVVANFFRNNCTNAFTGRRSGRLDLNGFNADIGASWQYGADSVIANNTHGNYATGSRVGFSQDPHCLSVIVANNVYLNLPYPIVAGNTMVTAKYQNNDFLGATNKYSDDDTNVSGVPRYTQIIFSGTNDFTYDPLLDAFGVPLAASPAIKAGANFVNSFSDRAGNAFFAATPTLGMYETATLDVHGTTTPGGTRKRKILHGESF